MEYKDIFQAGKSVAGISEICSATDIVAEYAQALKDAQ
jgi:hypothetical protein